MGTRNRILDIALGLLLVCEASRSVAQSPGYSPASDLPRALAKAITSGDTRIVVVGDSIDVNTNGDPSGATNTPLLAGIQRRWTPEKWHGIYAPNAQALPGGYVTVRGVGCATYDQADADESLLPMSLDTQWPGGEAGFGTEGCALAVFQDPSLYVPWAARATYRLFPANDAAGCAASQQLLSSPTLRARNLVYTNPAYLCVPGLAVQCLNAQFQFVTSLPAQSIDNTRIGWATLDFDVGSSLPPSFNRSVDTLAVETLPSRPPAGAQYANAGLLFYDPAAPGLQIHSIAQGGWNNDDHLRVSGPGRGYSQAGLRESLRSMGFADPGVTPVVMIATGSNIAGGESADGLSTQVFSDNIAAIMDRYRQALADIGAPEPWFLLVGMYSFGFPPDTFVKSRDDRMYENAKATPRCGFINLWTLMGSRGDTFDSSWYNSQPETHSIEPYSGGATLNTSGLAGFQDSDSFYITDGVKSAIGSFSGKSGSMLTGVVLQSAFAPGARILPYYADLHLSRAGAEHAADVMWAPIVAAANCSADFDGDTDIATDADIEAFFACLAGHCCPTCESADFNGDGDAATDADIEAFFRVLAGGSC
jgi:hypothetical protein